MIPNARFGAFLVDKALVQQVAKVFAISNDLISDLSDTDAARSFIVDDGFGYPAGKILLVDGAFVRSDSTKNVVREALTDTTFHLVVLELAATPQGDLSLIEKPNLHSIELGNSDTLSDLTHHLHEIKRSIEFIWLNAKIRDVLSDYERIYVEETDHSKRIRRFIDSLKRVLDAESLYVYLLDIAKETFHVQYQAGAEYAQPICKSQLDEFEFSQTCHSYRVPSAAKAKLGFTTVHEQDVSVVLSTFELFSVPGFVVFTFDPLYDETLMRELCAVGARELFHLLRVRLVRSQYDCLKQLTEITNIDAGKREVLWEVLNRLKAHFQVDGVSIVELVEEDGTSYFDKTYIHHGLKDFDKFPRKESFVEYCVASGRALIINETNVDEKYGIGLAFDSELTSEVGEPVRLATLVAPKGDENEASLMFYPLMQGNRVLGAIKLGDFAKSYSFDLHQLQALSVFADPIVALIDNIQHIQELKAKVQSSMERGQFANDAEALFFYREIALGVFHQVSNHLTSLYSTLQSTEMKAEARETKANELREPLGKSIKLAKAAKELIATAHHRGRTLKPITQRCQLVKDVLRPAFQYAEKRTEEFRTKSHLEHVFTNRDYVVYLDKELVKESIINILNNAVWAIKANKGTSKQDIFVGLRELTDEKSVRIEVTDSGVGIQKEDFSQLFTPFFTTKPDGTGLGLYFARKIIQEFGGTLTILRSQPGKGTTVEIIIPYQEVLQV